jgi:hypothetical protein
VVANVGTVGNVLPRRSFGVLYDGELAVAQSAHPHSLSRVFFGNAQIPALDLIRGKVKSVLTTFIKPKNTQPAAISL